MKSQLLASVLIICKASSVGVSLMIITCAKGQQPCML